MTKNSHNGANRCHPMQLRTSFSVADPAWDDFLSGVGGGHTQSSLWGRVKAAMGWRPFRVIAERGGQIIGGVQVLHRGVPALGSVGHVSRGPVLAHEDPALGTSLITEVERTAGEIGIRALAIQPAGAAEDWPGYLSTRGYFETNVGLTPRATVILDASRSLDDILAGMTSKTRYNVRLSRRRSVTVREGQAEDLDTYYELLSATARRQQFRPFPKSYFQHMWRTLSPGGHIRLTLAEVDGRPVSGQLAIAFGDTVVNKLSVWSGEAGKHRPNEALQWSAIEWANGNGYHFYDFEGVDLTAARSLKRGEPLPSSAEQSVTSFKVGFGGEVVLMPSLRVHVSNAVLRLALGHVYPHLAHLSATKLLLNRMRVGSRPPELRNKD